MMSVYIKGMEMPTRCGRCDMCITEADGDIDSHKACCITGAIIENLGEKMEDCPLVSVPPHGDLIDRQALLKLIEDPDDVGWVGYIDALDITCAPTIIEAEEGET